MEDSAHQICRCTVVSVGLSWELSCSAAQVPMALYSRRTCYWDPGDSSLFQSCNNSSQIFILPSSLLFIYSCLYQKLQVDTQDFTTVLTEVSKTRNKIYLLTKLHSPHPASKLYLISYPCYVKGKWHHGHLCCRSVLGLTLHWRSSLCPRQAAPKQSLKVPLDLAPFPPHRFQAQAVPSPSRQVPAHSSALTAHLLSNGSSASPFAFLITTES